MEATNSKPQYLWLSILIPVYKVQDYLEACAHSILTQTGNGIEVIFLDDASPDECSKILSELLIQYPEQIRTLKNDNNQGISAVRNTLLREARGDYIWFVDSDDLVEKGVIESLKKITDCHSPDLIMFDFKSFDSKSKIQHRSYKNHVSTFFGPSQVLSEDQNKLLTGLFKTGQFHPWSKVIRKACWPEHLIFPVGRIFEDLSVFPRLALHIKTFYHVPAVWLAYRQREGSALSQLTSKHVLDWMRALEGFPDDLKVAPFVLDEDAQFEVAHFCTRTFIRASKRQAKLKSEKKQEWQSRFTTLWERSSPLSRKEMIRRYLRRGHWLRGLQFMYWSFFNR